MFEILAILAVCFIIAVLFYKQANESFEIIQIDANRLDELPTLYSEHSPIVIRGFPVPALGTFAELSKRPAVVSMNVAPTLTLKALLGSEGSLRNWTWKIETAEFLAKEAGLTTWFQHNLFSKLLPSSYTSFLYSNKTSLWPHHSGLFKTKAFQTLLMPTQGTARVSIMLSKAEPFLPTKWQGKQFSSLTPADTPLLNQIQFVDVKLKRGNLLLLPAHLIVDVTTDSESGEPAWVFVGEVHHWISRLAGG